LPRAWSLPLSSSRLSRSIKPCRNSPNPRLALGR
jgi:hypothetical protein